MNARSTDGWVQQFAGKIPIAPVYSLDRALENPYVAQVGMLQAMPHPQRPDFRVLANPIKLDGERLPGRACPELGADTEALLADLGYDAEAIAALRKQGDV